MQISQHALKMHYFVNRTFIEHITQAEPLLQLFVYIYSYAAVSTTVKHWLIFTRKLIISSSTILLLLADSSLSCRPLNILSAMSTLTMKDFSMYPLATIENFYAPCLFKAIKSASALTKIVAKDRRKQCPVYSSACSKFKNFAEFFETLVLTLLACQLFYLTEKVATFKIFQMICNTFSI